MLAIVDYRAGNKRSVINAIERIGAEYQLTADVDLISKSDRVILPGVGHAASAMAELADRQLIDTLRNLTVPMLGICLGMQLLYDHTDEGDIPCLGIVAGRVKSFDTDLPVPLIGWSTHTWMDHRLLQGLDKEDMVYSVHSYRADVGPDTIAHSEYGGLYASAVAKNNFMGVQFHPEKSADTGMQILKNFMTI